MQCIHDFEMEARIEIWHEEFDKFDDGGYFHYVVLKWYPDNDVWWYTKPEVCYSTYNN